MAQEDNASEMMVLIGFFWHTITPIIWPRPLICRPLNPMEDSSKNLSQKQENLLLLFTCYYSFVTIYLSLKFKSGFFLGFFFQVFSWRTSSQNYTPSRESFFEKVPYFTLAFPITLQSCNQN